MVDGPWELNETRAKALAAAGVPNASLQTLALSGMMQPTVSLGDLERLAPVAFSPRYGVTCDVPAAAGLRSTVEIVGTTPWMLVTLDPIVNNVDIDSTVGPAITAATGNTRFFDPAETLAPKTLTFRTGTAPVARQGLLMEANRTFPLEILVEPGNVVTIQAGVNLQNFVSFVVQEYPGGAVRQTE